MERPIKSVRSLNLISFQTKINLSKKKNNNKVLLKFKLHISKQKKKKNLRFITESSFFNQSGVSDGKESACNVGDLGSIPGSGRSLGEGNGNPFQYSCLENPSDRGAWSQSMGSYRVGHD